MTTGWLLILSISFLEKVILQQNVFIIPINEMTTCQAPHPDEGVTSEVGGMVLVVMRKQSNFT